MGEAALSSAYIDADVNSEIKSSLSVTLAAKVASTPHSTPADLDDLAAALDKDACERYLTLLKRIRMVKDGLKSR